MHICRCAKPRRQGGLWGTGVIVLCIHNLGNGLQVTSRLQGNKFR